MSAATTLTGFARHELRLAWREWLAMVTGGRRGRKRAAAIGLIAFAATMHLPAYAVIGRFASLQAPLDKTSLIVLTSTIFLAWALMLSQAIESVTRVFYARADLDLIMSSPAKLANIFSVRIAAIALVVTGMALLFSTPFVDVLALNGGTRWLAGFGVVVVIGFSAAALAIAITILLTWFYNRSGGSVLVTALFHAGFNTFPFVLPYSPPFLALIFVWAIWVVISDRMWKSPGVGGAEAAGATIASDHVSKF